MRRSGPSSPSKCFRYQKTAGALIIGVFRFRKSKPQSAPRQADGAARQPQVNARLCADKFNGKYPHVGLYDCRARKVWVAKALSGQAIRTSHARLITGSDNAVSTVWKDR